MPRLTNSVPKYRKHKEPAELTACVMIPAMDFSGAEG